MEVLVLVQVINEQGLDDRTTRLLADINRHSINISKNVDKFTLNIKYRKYKFTRMLLNAKNVLYSCVCLAYFNVFSVYTLCFL